MAAEAGEARAVSQAIVKHAQKLLHGLLAGLADIQSPALPALLACDVHKHGARRRRQRRRDFFRATRGVDAAFACGAGVWVATSLHAVRDLA